MVINRLSSFPIILLIVLLKMQSYSTTEIAPLVGLTTGYVYARSENLRKS